MHKLVKWFFKNLNNIGQTLSLICSFLIMTDILYWLENILKAQWNWLNFIKPILDVILDFSNNIFPFSFSAFGTVFDIKFVTATVVLLLLMLVFRFFIEGIGNLENMYDEVHFSHKKNVEKNFNKQLINTVITEEKKVSEYMVLIKTRLKKKYNHKEININMLEQNNLMNKFISEKTNNVHEAFEDGFLYRFGDFNKIDNVIEVLFKVLNSTSPLDYLICIQAGNDTTKLSRLADLQYFGKIVFCADTLLRYKCNNFHRYGTKVVGIFQKDYGTIEVHEFHIIL